jgi:type II secretory pathway component PulF
MTTFATVFIDEQGRRRSDRMAAQDLDALKETLRSRSQWLVSARPATSGKRLSRFTLPVRDFVPLLHQLELQLRAGVTADAALGQLAEDAPEGASRIILRSIHEEVANGQPIHEACRRFPRLFPDHLAAVISAGETASQLPESIRALAHHLTSMDELKRTARRALIYPAVVLSATAGLVIFLLTGVVPRFAEIFASLSLTLPPITLFMIRLSDFLLDHGLWVVGATGLVLIGLAATPRIQSCRRLRDALLLKLPLLGDIIRHLATARFAAHCRLLHNAGVPMLATLATGAELTGHALLSKQLLMAREAVAAGKPLYAALPKGHGFPQFVVPALKAGETTGQLGSALQHIEDYASSRANERLNTALALLEPILLGSLAAVVGAIALSFFLPLISLLGGVNSR